jgi:hypothetical protein
MKWQETIIVGAGIVRDLRGFAVGCNSQPVPVAVWPAKQSVNLLPTGDSRVGTRALNMIVYPTNNCYIGIDRVPNTIGPNSAILMAGQEYVFNLHPDVKTIFLLDAVSNTGPVFVRFAVP